MEPIELQVEYYRTVVNRVPFWEWHNSLKDMKTRAIVDIRVARIRAGNFGHCEPVGEDVLELKIDYGPGYRIYLRKVERCVVLLLSGGDKSTQNKDIQKAKEFWHDYQARDL